MVPLQRVEWHARRSLRGKTVMLGRHVACRPNMNIMAGSAHGEQGHPGNDRIVAREGVRQEHGRG